MTNIDWDQILDSLKNGEVRTVGEDFYRNEDGRFNEIINLWKSANYTRDKVEWINFYPGVHFDESVSMQVADLLEIKHIRSWISCIRPGKNAPWHQDIDDDFEKYLKLGKLVRYTVHIQKPFHGSVVLIEKNAYYMMPQGSVTKWDDPMSWHGSSNCGFQNHYLYHILGYLDDI